MIPQATSIEEVITILNTIINDSIKDNNPLGYFAVLYCKVTEKVKEGISEGLFENGPRMEQLDVIFANRYIKAYYEYQQRLTPSDCWEVAFEFSSDYWIIVLQHLLLGMNAHINLDLGIAAAEIAPGDEIHNLKRDFDKINEVLASLVQNVETALSDVWPILKWILKATQKVDTFLIDFSMQEAREGAWKFALSLAPLDSVSFTQSIENRDRKITEIADLIVKPGKIASFLFKIMRLFEIGNVASKIEKLKSVI